MEAGHCYDDRGSRRPGRNSLKTPAERPDWKLLEVRPIPPEGGRIICVANQKGGVAKTTTSVNLAAALALRGQRVLVVDVDPQGNATTGLGIDRTSVEVSSYDLLLGEGDLTTAARATAIDGLNCVPATLDLAGAEIELVGSLAREHKLSEALATATADYRFVFIDCPPSLGLLTVNALVAARDLLVPVQCEYYALEGLGQLLGTAERVRSALNPELRISGMLLTMYDARTKLSSQVSDEVRAHFGDFVFKTVIPRSVRLSEAPSFGEPVLTLDPSSRGAISYKLLAAEMEQRYAPTEIAPRAASATEPAQERTPAPVVTRATPGPAVRGYGTTTIQPPGLDDAWPRVEPQRDIDLTDPVPSEGRRA